MCAPHLPSVLKFICRLYIRRSHYLQKVAIIVGCSNYWIYQIQNTCLNMKCFWRCMHVYMYVCVSDTLSRMSNLTNDDGALNEVGCFLFACKLWMCVLLSSRIWLYIYDYQKVKIVKVENMKLTFTSHYIWKRNCWHLILRLR